MDIKRCTKESFSVIGEVNDDAEAPEGWTKWTIPAYEFLYIKVENGINDTFSSMIKYLEENKIGRCS